ncbi:hypothetical protein BC941DRAFT_419398 [Chlamydoabsidia padenii]|nr:hypothetical protein BC941DRAFT_419398 [Chlamydoabsidia padenii]
MDLEHHVLESMFEKSLYSDLTLAFYHASFPFTMRFNVHKAIVAQSPFLRLLLDNADHITTVETAPSSTSCDKPIQHHTLHLTIDLIDAMARRGFVMTPAEHIIRRQWQQQDEETQTQVATQRHILSSHLRFALKWLYSMDRLPLIKTLKDEDTLRVLSVAILFELDELVQGCLERYTTDQLSIHSIISDLEVICQLPRHHTAYHQLRDATLLLLLRYGPNHPAHLAQLPVDYMSDVLSVDMLYVGYEYDRYCLLREVLMAFMRSVGKITWTAAGPVDQDLKRLSGFVRNPLVPQQQQQQPQRLTATDVRLSSQKRKRIPSEELLVMTDDRQEHKQQRLTRLSFSACVPFKKLVADASSGGVIDKATILSYLLRNTVNYSNMTFDQLSIVRQDGIVDESIVFRALWQREALERLLYPFNYQQSQQLSSTQTYCTSIKSTSIPRFSQLDLDDPSSQQDVSDRRAALNEYFDVGDCDEQEKRRRILLGSPRFRFCASVDLALPWNSNDDDDDNGWDVVEVADHSANTQLTASDSGLMKTFDDDGGDNDDDDDSVWASEDELDEATQELLDRDPSKHTLDSSKKATETTMDRQQQQQQQYRIYNKTIYSGSEYILGYWHRVRLEAQILPRSSLQQEHKDDTQVLVCRFELERDLASQQQQQQQQAQQTKIRYDIYCLNRHDVVDHSDRVDPEDRVLVPVSRVTDEEKEGYVDQVVLAIDSLASKSLIEIDIMVALEIFGFDKV